MLTDVKGLVSAWPRADVLASLREFLIVTTADFTKASEGLSKWQLFLLPPVLMCTLARAVGTKV